jgi:TonB family protein
MYKNLKYPQKAITNKQKGLLKVEYVVRKDGSITNLEIPTKETSQELNNEVLRVMKLMPKFKPAVYKGKKVSYRDREFIDFQLKPCSKKEFYPIIITPTDCGLPSFSPDAKGVFTFTEKMPEYPGGDEKLSSYISKNVNLLLPPITGYDDFHPERVIIRFIVNEKGKVTNPEIIRGENTLYNKISLQVINSLPDWIPGEHKGKKVAVYYTLPVTFRR